MTAMITTPKPAATTTSTSNEVVTGDANLDQKRRIQEMQKKIAESNAANAAAQAAFATREGDVVRGETFAKDILGEEGLGRLGTDSDMQRIIEERRKLSTGLTGEEMQGARDIALQGINQGTQTQSRAMQALQARTGVRGGTAAAQLSSVLGEGAQRKADFEKDLMLQNRSTQESGINALETSVSGLRQFDLAQLAAEKQMIASGGLGFAQLGVAERSADKASDAQVQAANAKTDSCFHPDQKVELADGSIVKFKHLELGQELIAGEYITAVGVALAHDEDIYEYNDVLVTGSHSVLEDGRWVIIADSEYAYITDIKCPVVYCLRTNTGTITINKSCFADFTPREEKNSFLQKLISLFK